MSEVPWVAVSEVCSMYGVTYESAKNKILAGTFPVATYKLGKKWVIDKKVHEQFFAHRRAEGLEKLAAARLTTA